MDHITKSYLGKSDVVVSFQITKEDDVFVAQCVELPGCISQGDTMEEAKANIASALEEFLPIFIHDASCPRRMPPLVVAASQPSP